MARTITITTSSFGKDDMGVLSPLKSKNFKIVANPYGRKLAGNEIVELCRDSCGIIAGTEVYTSEILAKLVNLKVISRCGIGLDSIDLEAAKKLGMKIYNTPDAPTLAVAELTVGLILAVLRKTRQMDNSLRKGSWEKLTGNLLSGKTVGLVGFGRIGRKVADLLEPFGCKVVYTDPNIEKAYKGVSSMSLNDLLEGSDIVSIHASTDKVILGKKELGLLKGGAFLINVSRGGIVDEEELYLNLKSGNLAGAALDVFEKEPYKGKLTELDNIILTPHIGSYAKEARMNMEREAVGNLIKGLNEEA